MKVHSSSILFITIDSCRYDTFEQVKPENMLKIGPLHRAYAPGNFTYASHAAMFMGFTPGDPLQRNAIVNPKFGKLFRMQFGGFETGVDDCLLLEGRNVIDGLKSAGWKTLGTSSMGWFDPGLKTGRVLTDDFDQFYYPGGKTWCLDEQLAWVNQQLEEHHSRPVFLFMNIGETHVPYYFEGAPWSSAHNPCVPFSDENDADVCRQRQQECLRFIDAKIGEVLDCFEGCTTLICADHGDCWGEDGLWEHGVHHEKVLEVPLIYKLGASYPYRS